MSKPVEDHLQADLSAYLDDELPPERRAALEAWLAGSAAAQAELAALRRVKTQLAGLPRVAAPAELAPNVLARAAQHRPPSTDAAGTSQRRMRRWARLTLRISSAAAVLVLGAFLGAAWQAHLQSGFSGSMSTLSDRVADLPALQQAPGAAPPAAHDAALPAVQDEYRNYAKRQLKKESESGTAERRDQAVVAPGSVDVCFTSASAADLLKEQPSEPEATRLGVAVAPDSAATDKDVAAAPLAQPRAATDVGELDADAAWARVMLRIARHPFAQDGKSTDAPEDDASRLYGYYFGATTPTPHVSLVVPTTSLGQYSATADALAAWAAAAPSDWRLDRKHDAATPPRVLQVRFALQRSEFGARLGQLMALNEGAPLQISARFDAHDGPLAWDMAQALTQSQWKADMYGRAVAVPTQTAARASVALRPPAGGGAAPTSATREEERIAATPQVTPQAPARGAVGGRVAGGQAGVSTTEAPPPMPAEDRVARDTLATGLPAIVEPPAATQPALIQMEVILVPPPSPTTAPTSAPAATSAPAPPDK